MQATQPTQLTQPMHATHPIQPLLPSPATMPRLETVPALSSTPALAMIPALAIVPALPTTPALATVPALPITPALATVPALPTTPALATVAALAMTPELVTVAALALTPAPSSSPPRSGSGSASGWGSGNTEVGVKFCKLVRRHSTSRRRSALPSALGSTFRSMLVNELSDGVEIDQVLLVREAERRQRRDGGDYLRLQLGDRTGAVVCMVWDELEPVEELARAGAPVQVSGRYTVHPRFGPQINLRSLQAAAPGSFDESDLLDGPAREVGQMESEVRELLATIQQPHLRLLLERLFGEGSEMWAGFRTAPAAKHYHQAYRHGLLEHCLGVAQAVSAISATFPGIDRDVAVTGALLHDIGKLEAYGDDLRHIELTDAGRLHGEIALGYYRIRRAIEQIDDFPPELGQAVGHIILSHHGTLEHGSPVVPCTREATLVHMIDNLGGRLGSFDRLEKELAPGRRWSAFDRAIGGSALFGERGGEQAELGQPPEPARKAA
jgi:3'-5' exoribonuclease